MYKYIVRRLLVMIPMLFIITVVVFTFAKLAPGDAFTGEPDPNVEAEALEAKRELYGLNDPPHIQYLTWLGNVLQGEFGMSLRCPLLHRVLLKKLAFEKKGHAAGRHMPFS